MPRIDPSRQDSMSESILRFYHNQNWAKIEFYMKFGRFSIKFDIKITVSMTSCLREFGFR